MRVRIDGRSRIFRSLNFCIRTVTSSIYIMYTNRWADLLLELRIVERHGGWNFGGSAHRSSAWRTKTSEAPGWSVVAGRIDDAGASWCMVQSQSGPPPSVIRIRRWIRRRPGAAVYTRFRAKMLAFPKIRSVTIGLVTEWVGINVPINANRSFRRRLFPVNHFHWYWQPNKNNQERRNTQNTKITQHKERPWLTAKHTYIKRNLG